MNLSSSALADKVRAGWIGKNIGGTLGGPLEGITKLMNVRTYTQEFVGPVENDDLDLQLVALHCIEEHGGAVNAHLLAQEWLSHVFFQYDEYGHSLTNLRNGLVPPLSGRYDNFFTDCMGAPIRSELWAMVCAGNPDAAAILAKQDAMVDHAGGEGQHGEVFFAVFEALAFVNQNIPQLIQCALTYLPETCGVALAVNCLLSCHSQGLTWQETRAALITRFDNGNFTYAPINVAFTLLGLLYGTGFTERLLITTNCGYDTDCTCATIASMMGILYGTAYIDASWTQALGENIIVSKPIQGLSAPKNITELTQRTLAARERLQMQKAAVFDENEATNIQSFGLPATSVQHPDLWCTLHCENEHPAIALGKSKWLKLDIKNEMLVSCDFDLCAKITAGAVQIKETSIHLEPGETKTVTAVVNALEKVSRYRGCFELKRKVQNVFWCVEEIPFTLMPTLDWEINGSMVSLPDHRLVSAGAPIREAKTVLHVEQDLNAHILINCEKPVCLYVDDVCVLMCAESTPVLPAYHRSDPRKTITLSLKKGKHLLSLRIDKAAQEEPVFVHIVSDLYFAAHINICFAFPNEPVCSEKKRVKTE